MLNDWTFAVTVYDPSQDRNVPVQNATLSIFQGNGNGGTLVGSSTTSTVTTLANRTATQWTFADGGLSLIDNQRYTAVLVGSGNFDFRFDASSVNPYANGFLTVGNNAFGSADWDTVFSANFSEATPVPLESDALPIVGSALFMAGGLWWKKKRAQAKVADFVAKK